MGVPAEADSTAICSMATGAALREEFGARLRWPRIGGTNGSGGDVDQVLLSIHFQATLGEAST